MLAGDDSRSVYVRPAEHRQPPSAAPCAPRCPTCRRLASGSASQRALYLIVRLGASWWARRQDNTSVRLADSPRVRMTSCLPASDDRRHIRVLTGISARATVVGAVGEPACAAMPQRRRAVSCLAHCCAFCTVRLPGLSRSGQSLQVRPVARLPFDQPCCAAEFARDATDRARPCIRVENNVVRRAEQLDQPTYELVGKR